MAVIVVGGHTKNIGKTSVVCGLISALPDRCSTAIKISQSGCCASPDSGAPGDRDGAGHSFSITEEQHSAGGPVVGGTDTSRYLAAGALRALWIHTCPCRLAEAMPRIRVEVARAQNIVLESNSVLRYLQPDVYVSVLDPEVADFKATAALYVDQADAILLPAGGLGRPNWPGVSAERIAPIPQFRIGPPTYSSAAFVSFITKKMRIAEETAGKRATMSTFSEK
jgi:hypothetical protein